MPNRHNFRPLHSAATLSRPRRFRSLEILG
jgi:hypothetical protein